MIKVIILLSTSDADELYVMNPLEKKRYKNLRAHYEVSKALEQNPKLSEFMDPSRRAERCLQQELFPGTASAQQQPIPGTSTGVETKQVSHGCSKSFSLGKLPEVVNDLQELVNLDFIRICEGKWLWCSLLIWILQSSLDASKRDGNVYL